MFSMIWDDDGLVSESRWICRTLPLTEIFLSSSLQKSSSLSFSWWTDSLRSSKETSELKRSSFTSVDSGGAERDWKLYRKQKSQLISSTQGWHLYKWKKSSDMRPIWARFPQPKAIHFFQKKMIRWESDWWLYNKTLMKCFSVSLVSQQDLLKSTMMLFF